MTIEEKLRVIAECLRSLQGGEWSAREVIDLARTIDAALPKCALKFRNETAYRALYEFDLPGRRAAGKRRLTAPRGAIPQPSEGPREMLPGSNSGSISGAFQPSPQGSLSPAPPISPNPSLFTLTSFGPGAETGTAAHAQKAKNTRKSDDLTWVAGVESGVLPIMAKALESLSPDERLALGRYHALHFGNCTRGAIQNAARGQNIAAGLTDLGSISRFKDITVREYLVYCRRVHKGRGGKPWFNPFLIKGMVEFE